MSGTRFHGLTLAFVLVLATAGGAHGPHWIDFTAHKGMNSKVQHYLDSIKALANAAPTAAAEPNYIAPGTKASINTVCDALKVNHHQGHSEPESVCRIIVAYRLASRFHWDGCKTYLTTHAPEPVADPAWKDYVLPANTRTVGQLLTDIKNDVNGAKGPTGALKTAILALITAREANPHAPGHAWAEDYARIMLAYYYADGVTGGADPAWVLCKNELDHPEPSESPKEGSNK